ncbi:hypothetical protein GCM10022276_00140 [Sphingomonas limnosediminicola]|jgi:hypothetical protein|uniref:Uncharacterized protein n=1 Tax=Sphingomonas limnosediminicola TaxID=940133 RepID=A0ABP7KTD3_9SPHN
MDKLNWVFSLYAVVLGLTLAEVLTGFARSIRLRHTALRQHNDGHRLGLLTPLLAIFLMLDISSFWVVAWTLQDRISVGPMTLAFGLLVTGLYYVAASWVFPEPEERGNNLDDHFFRQKGLIFSLIFASNITTYLGRSWLVGSVAIPGYERYDYVELGLYYLLQIAGILVPGKKANLAVLVSLLLLTLDFTTGAGPGLIRALQ